jgi:ornithine cyclodeaminase/alanine dehydrogenase-like protein (mu-crystallin family)
LSRTETFGAVSGAGEWPLIRSSALLSENSTGRLLALIEGSSIVTLRASAASAVATRYLAADTASVLCIVGTGVQAGLHLAAMLRVRDIRRVFIVGRTSAGASAFAASALGKYGGGIQFETTDLMRAASLADIICLCTDSRVPVLLGNHVKAGCHINAIGACGLDAREVDTNTVLRSKVVIEDKEMGIGRAGDLRIPFEEKKVPESAFQSDMAELTQGKAVRGAPSDITLFKSVGHPAVDFHLAVAAYQAALQRKVGVEVDF